MFATFWFILTLLPIVFIPNHVSPQQEDIAIFGILLILVLPFDYMNKRLNKYLKLSLIIIVVSIWYIASWTTVTLNNRIHWINRRSKIVQYWLEKTSKLYPALKSNSTVIINTTDYETQVALGEGRAIHELYSDSSLKVIFSTKRSTSKNSVFIP